jgi:hypothetical protein
VCGGAAVLHLCLWRRWKRLTARLSFAERGVHGGGYAEISSYRRLGVRPWGGRHGVSQPDRARHARASGAHLSYARAVRERSGHRRAQLCHAGRRQDADRSVAERHADIPRSAFRLSQRRRLRRDAGPDPGRVRRPGHRNHQRRRSRSFRRSTERRRRGRASRPATTSPRSTASRSSAFR